MKKFAGLEICRFLCALAVILWHYQHFFLPGMWTDAMVSTDRTQFPLYPMLRLFYENGDKAVAIFWVISGFIFFWKYADGIHAGQCRAGSFLVWRISRLYPLHFLTLLTVAILQHLYLSQHPSPFIYGHNDLAHFLTQLGLASNWVGSQPFTFNGPVWSISAEILVYAMFFAFARCTRPGLIQAASVVLLAGLVLQYRSGQPAVACAQFFFAGGVLQQLLAKTGPQYRRVVFGLCVAGAVGLSAGHHAVPMTRTMLLGLAICIVGAFALLDTALGIDLSRLAPLGDLTYSSYLLHFPWQLALVLIADRSGYGRGLFLSPIALILFLGSTFGLAWFFHRRFEMPMQDAIRSWWLSRSRWRTLSPYPRS